MHRDVEAHLSEVQSRRNEVVSIAQELIRIPSEDPPGDTTAIGTFVANLFEAAGIPFEIIAPQKHMPNVVAHFDGRRGDPEIGNHLTFNGHMDTFLVTDPDTWEHDPFGGEIEDGKLFGRGAGDMHGGFAATLSAFLYLFDHRSELTGQATFAAVSHEESGGNWGTKYLVENYPEYRGDAVLSGECSSTDFIVFAEKGHLWLDVRAHSEGGHAALPGPPSAISNLLPLLRDIESLERDDKLIGMPERVQAVIADTIGHAGDRLGAGDLESFSDLTVNIGTISGGSKINLVAEYASAEVDIRLPVGTTPNAVLDRVEEMARSCSGEIFIDVQSQADPSHSDVNHDLVQTLRQNAAIVRSGDEPLFTGSAGFTDCRFYRYHDIPAVWYGPSVYNIGTQDEYIYIHELMEAAQAHTLTGLDYLGALRSLDV